MANYVVLYSGGGGMGATEEEQQRIMAEWGEWYGKQGEAIVDGGAAFGASKNITAGGTGDGPLGDTPATGYTVISADSLDAATAACADHPHISHGGAVQVFETIDM